MLGVAAGGEGVRIRIGHDEYGRTRQPGGDAHLVDHILQLPELQLAFLRYGGQRLVNRHRPGGQQYRPIAPVVAGPCGQTANPEREHAPDGERCAGTQIQAVESVPKKEEERHEYEHDGPRPAPIRGLLLEELHYFFIDKSTAGTCLSAASVSSKSPAGLNPNIEASRLEGNVCCEVLKLVEMSL